MRDSERVKCHANRLRLLIGDCCDTIEQDRELIAEAEALDAIAAKLEAMEAYCECGEAFPMTWGNHPCKCGAINTVAVSITNAEGGAG